LELEQLEPRNVPAAIAASSIPAAALAAGPNVATLESLEGALPGVAVGAGSALIGHPIVPFTLGTTTTNFAPAANGIPAIALTSNRLNAARFAGSVYLTGTLEDQSYFMQPTPFNRVSIMFDQPYTGTTSSARAYTPRTEGFKGTNDEIPETSEEDVTSQPIEMPTLPDGAVEFLLGGPEYSNW
jgi:hypothetical protein